ncbi:DUF4276 family protein [Geminocystis herdmanii]|uniref:DUF4276 family protein n=1 Tax=Geminocystis herdmanii TaxID=669359 RepID=UPI000346AE6F|nr:DUF4276 family protein [Geminocystis herdmanii]
MNLEFLVEEASLKEALQNLLPKILPSEIAFNIHDFRGKEDLLKKLPNRLKGYKAWIPNDYKIIVMIDEDREDCLKLKQKLEDIAKQSGFITKSSKTNNQDFQVLNRIVVEELEAWFFGDINAIHQAYPRVSKNIANQQSYRNPDNIKGGTWEALEKILNRAGYFKGGLQKLVCAREISGYMNPDENRSKSFQVFIQGLQDIIKT